MLCHPTYSYTLPWDLTMCVLYLLIEVVAFGKCFLLNKNCNCLVNCMLSWKKCCQKLCKMYPLSIALVCMYVHMRTTLEEFQMSGSVLNKIKIQMCSGFMQNNRALVFHRNNKFLQLCFTNSHIILHWISWGMKSVCLLHTVLCHGSQQNFQQMP
jgi:hypothetical protein